MPTSTPSQQWKVPLLYAHEHQSCHNYSNTLKAPIGIVNLHKGEVFKNKLEANEVIYAHKGRIAIQCEPELRKFYITEQQFFALPMSNSAKATALEDSLLIIMRMHTVDSLCERLSFESLQTLQKKTGEENAILNAVKPVEQFFNGLADTMEAGILCQRYQEVKLREFLLLLRHFYKKEEVAAMLSSILSSDMKFWSFVMSNHEKVNSTQEFAQLLPMTVDSFERKFKKVFGVTVKHFIDHNKGVRAKSYLIGTQMAVKDISAKLGFDESSNFTRFFKRMYKLSPLDFREKNKNFI